MLQSRFGFSYIKKITDLQLHDLETSDNSKIHTQCTGIKLTWVWCCVGGCNFSYSKQSEAIFAEFLSLEVDL